MLVAFWFAYSQFTTADTSVASAAVSNEIEVKNQVASLAFKSRSLATFIMVVSLAFFLTNLMFVFPIVTSPPPELQRSY